MKVIPICADYTAPFQLPPLPGPSGKLVSFFGGTTIGNFEPEAAKHLLTRCGHILGPGSGMVIGVDLKKEARTSSILPTTIASEQWPHST
jgi:uncharacterized SAM-dependent methyltransferase